MLSNSFAWSSFSFTTVSETMRNVVTYAESCDTHLFVHVLPEQSVEPSPRQPVFAGASALKLK